MSRLVILIGVLAAATLSASARAADAARWYVAPLGSYDLVDKARCTDDGIGATAAVGRKDKSLSFEYDFQYLSLSYTCPGAVQPSGTGKLKSSEILVLGQPFDAGPAFKDVYGLFGVGAQRRNAMAKLPVPGDNLFVDVGAAYIHDLTLFGKDLALRADARYRYISEGLGKSYGTASSFQDVIINLGVQIPLFAPPPPAPAPEPVAVVPVPEPTPAPVVEPVAVEPAPVVEPVPAEPAPPAPPTIETAKAGDTIVLNGVNFETGKASLTANAKTLLDGVAKDLVARPELNVEVGGHTDARGKAAYNQGLSDRRARAVMDYLVGAGVAQERLSSKGYGPTQPVDTNETDEGRERNRRVELKVVQ